MCTRCAGNPSELARLVICHAANSVLKCGARWAIAPAVISTPCNADARTTRAFNTTPLRALLTGLTTCLTEDALIHTLLLGIAILCSRAAILLARRQRTTSCTRSAAAAGAAIIITAASTGGNATVAPTVS